MYEEERERFLELKKKVLEGFALIRPEEKKRKLSLLEREREKKECYEDIGRLREVSAAIVRVEKDLLPWEKLLLELSNLEAHLEIAEEAQAEDERGELEEALARHMEGFRELETLQFFKEETDRNNVYLSIHAGAGGKEACDWAMMLYRMYIRWAERMGFKSSVIEYQAGDGVGLKSATLFLEGEYAAGFLKSEIGVHRLVRLSPFDAAKRRHTSFSSVFLTPELTDLIEVHLVASELRIDTFRSSGAGGQHVNTTDSAVRITHLPTNLVAACQAERSQHQNKEKAVALLKAKLYEHYAREKAAVVEAKKQEKKKIEWGSQIRSYIMHPYNLVKDHITGHETSNVRKVLDGFLEGFIDAYLRR